jgi:hypothetical protein
MSRTYSQWKIYALGASPSIVQGRLLPKLLHSPSPLLRRFLTCSSARLRPHSSVNNKLVKRGCLLPRHIPTHRHLQQAEVAAKHITRQVKGVAPPDETENTPTALSVTRTSKLV